MKLEDIGFYSLYDSRAENASSISQMKRCEMIITEYCNFRCAYCRGLKKEIYGNRKKPELSIKEIQRNIDFWCEKEPLENIRFSGGEPTIHSDIKKAVSYAKQKRIQRIAISTNGSANLELYKELINLGVNDYSISLDACCASEGDKLSGGIKGSWDVVVKNIEEISKLTYVTVGIVFTLDNLERAVDTINFAHGLGVSDIRIISSAQYNKPMTGLERLHSDVLLAHPILKYRVNNFKKGRNVRGLCKIDSRQCGLVLDDSVIAGEYHFPCVIYMREKGEPIGKVSSNMRRERADWHKNHNVFKDEICKKNCLDVCIDYNNKWAEAQKENENERE